MEHDELLRLLESCLSLFSLVVDFYNKDDIFNLTDANETEIDDTVSKLEDEENSTAV